jgi:hypothetical protein
MIKLHRGDLLYQNSTFAGCWIIEVINVYTTTFVLTYVVTPLVFKDQKGKVATWGMTTANTWQRVYKASAT